MTAIVCIALILAAVPVDDDAMQQKLAFLEGDWKTVSTFTASGEVAPGTLSYHWVLGGAWLQCTFHGDRADGRVWEAHAMLRWDGQKGHYVSWAFFGPGDPIMYSGTALEDGTLRFEFTNNGARTGIDYCPRMADSVYQENWTIGPDGERRITLKTDYTRVAPR